MNNKYFNQAKKQLKNNLDIDIIDEIVLCRKSRLVLYTDNLQDNDIMLHIIAGSLSTLEFEDNESIRLQTILNHFDENNKYAEVAGKKEYKSKILQDFYDVNTETNQTFPIIVNDVRNWIRMHIVPHKKHKNVAAIFITVVTKFLIEEEELFEKTHKDSLTKVFNKYTLDYHYGERSENDPLHILFLDLDDFKIVNDEFGHKAGNEYLRKFASILHKFEDDYDRFYRIGGDEFIGLIFQGKKRVMSIANEILKRTREIHYRGDKPLITVSIGILKANKRLDSINKADKLMYKAKKEGKDCIIYDIEEEM